MKVLLTAVLALLLLALAACGSGGVKSKASTQKTTNHGVKNVSGLSSVDVEMDDYYFSPTLIKASPGQKLTVHLSNRGSVEHNFSIASQGIHRDVPPGKTASVRVILPRTGTITFFCKYHRARGMAGRLRARQPAFLG